MLTEYGFPGEQDGHLKKRWFSDSFFDLYVWLDRDDEIASFQLCYNKPHDEHALTWKRPASYYHQRVDDGENRPGKSKSTPVLLPDGAIDNRSLAERFALESKDLDARIAKFVREKILGFRKPLASSGAPAS